MSRIPVTPRPAVGKTDRQQVFVRRRIEAVAGLIALGIVMLAIRAVDLQWIQADKLSNLAEKQRYRQYTAIAPRGSITDAKGRILAESVETASIAVMADEIPADKIAPLAKALGMPEKVVNRKIHGRKGFVWLARQITPSQAAAVAALNIPGVRKESEWRRYHPLGPETGHLLGFVGIDGHGLEGVERVLDDQLSGEAGIRQVRRDARGHSLPGGIWLRDPVPGKSISLTLDASIQSIAYAALADGIRKQQAKGGSVVVMRPKDGAILAMASWPGYNPNNFREFHPSEWRNRAITDVFEPGSTLKPFTVAAALMSGRWQADSRIFCENGALQVADHVIHDDHSEGWLDMSGLLAKSSNIGAAKLALDIGVQPLHKMLDNVGFGHRSHVGLNGESPGIVLPAERWGPVETANIAFGQGIAVTPLQLATAFSVLANGGIYVQPKLIRNDKSEQILNNQARRIMPANIAHQVLSMLEYATSSEGTG
ncbi:MAG: penicillin-binding protein 2, partial [Mariprofundaceae bacterium]